MVPKPEQRVTLLHEEDLQKGCGSLYLPDYYLAIAKQLRIVVIERIVIMSVVIPNEILTATRMTEGEMKQEIAVMLFQKEKLTLAQASRFAGMNRIAFQHLLASRQISVHYGVEDFEEDIKNLRAMGKL
ncbi:UPF0175 family protein [Nostoc sp.]|uniref:UPF0175 family protein n=1 Tax=Nostoc sp. TaxID=1180 RepID=UPI003FA594C5